MASLTENVMRVADAVGKIRDAILNKGGTIEGGLDTYANAIESIPSGGGGGSTMWSLWATMYMGTNTSSASSETRVTNQFIDENFTFSNNSFVCQKQGKYRLDTSIYWYASSSSSSSIAFIVYVNGNGFNLSSSTSSGVNFIKDSNEYNLNVGDTITFKGNYQRYTAGLGCAVFHKIG